MTRAKICGLSTAETVVAAVEGRADYIGFNFFPKSPRYVTPEQAAALAEPARGKCKIVAVVVDPGHQWVHDMVTILRPDFVQMHGAEPAYRVSEVARYSGRPIIKAVPVSIEDDIKTADTFDGMVDHLMFDTKPPKDADMPGGTGLTFDWDLLKDRRFQRPYFLAGGLDPWNVGEAIARSGAPVVDVSSGVERGPGLKDSALIAAFLDAVRRS
jgi:phosphoribosylanthranilate isomerase